MGSSLTRKAFLVTALALMAVPSSSALAQSEPRTRVVVTDSAAKPGSTPVSDNSATALPLLRTRISMTIANPALRRGSVGIKVISLDSGETVYERDAEKYFMPASNMKSFTVAAALDRLGPEHRFTTSIYAPAKPEGGVVKGDLIIFGRGDPAFSWRYNGGDWLVAIDNLADKLIAAGVKKIEGNIVGDGSYFNTEAVPFGWEWDDLQWYYGAEVSALSVNDNVVVMKVSPSTIGLAPLVAFEPTSTLFRVVNTAKTVPSGERKTLKIAKRPKDNVYEISGNLPAGDPGFSGTVSISNPPQVFADLLKQRLALKGVTVTGNALGVDRFDRGGEPLKTEGLFEVVSHPSPPLSLIAENTMKPSQNLYTEILLRSLGETTGDPSDLRKTSEEKGMAVINELLKKAGVPLDSVVQYDASGLSRHNLITPNASAMLYKYLDTARYSAFWKNSLTIGGVDGTLRRRFKGTSASGNVRGKTGTIDQVSALSGYVTSKAGERFAFAIITNGIPDAGTRVSAIDEIVLQLANLEEKTFFDPTPQVVKTVQ
ncbi:MAG: D-alanyl-D-alanine carboxypeptidase/D-alanyl-D-alanine-endopeptidase [Acidobacteriota bacterium]|nr:MAG: D-alanyl-D-alanine carboxypeptidase/D-alanyl-D-alanine-endopeptidase [Acidobacteriota bacterium]